MPKDRRASSLSMDRVRASPYPCSSKDSDDNRCKGSLPPGGDEREWEEARCPICMEHPHNTVLLLCSSQEKGCRPYMCNTSSRHSNCLDQFCKSSSATATDQGRVEQPLSGTNRHPRRLLHDLVCPLCRGQITGWVVIEAARNFMNSKPRSCTLETCDYSGNYGELRKHARREHPSLRPTVVDPIRQSEWMSLESQRDFQDTLSAYRSVFGDDNADQTDFYDDFGDGDVLTHMTLQGGFFDILSGVHSDSDDESDDAWSIDADFLMDMELDLELSFSFLNDLSFGPSGWYNEPRGLDGERNDGTLQSQRSTRSRSSSDTTLSARRNRSSSRRTPAYRSETLPSTRRDGNILRLAPGFLPRRDETGRWH